MDDFEGHFITPFNWHSLINKTELHAFPLIPLNHSSLLTVNFKVAYHRYLLYYWPFHEYLNNTDLSKYNYFLYVNMVSNKVVTIK